MKVLHILDHSLPLFSGYSFRSANIVKFQKLGGMEPIVLTSPKQGTVLSGVEEIDGIRHYRVPVLEDHFFSGVAFLREVLMMQRMARNIRRVAMEEKVDVIHSHSPSLNGLPARKIASQLSIPVVYEARAFWEDAAVDHGTFLEGSWRYNISRTVENVVFKKVDAVVVIAEAMRRELLARGIAPKKISVIPNGVDIDGFHPRKRNAQLAQQLNLNGGSVFGFAGSFYHYEGLRFLLKVFAEILARIPKAKLLLIGGGPEEAMLREASAALGPAVVFVGRVPHAQVPEYCSLIDIFVFPRQQMRLTDLVTPLKPLEAMAMGKVVLASDVGGHRELIQHGITGLMFRADDAESFITEAVKAASDPHLCDALGKAGRAHVECQRAWPQIVAKYEPIYRQLLH
jgi:PEP-CTERM/exosortase 1-associated glycosyltransferase, Daro_2409 family